MPRAGGSGIIPTRVCRFRLTSRGAEEERQDAITRKIVVNLNLQVLLAHEDEKQVYEYDSVSGDNDHPTDPGTFSIFRKERK